MWLLVESDLKPAGDIVGLGFEELRWLRPLRAGDELWVRCEVLKVRPSRSRMNHGLLKAKTASFDRQAEALQDLAGNFMVSRRANRR